MSEQFTGAEHDYHNKLWDPGTVTLSQ
jgi:hypothetical protein